MPPLPVSDPYEEIYSKRVQDVWWGMVDETLLDPAKLSGQTDSKSLKPYRIATGILAFRKTCCIA